MDPYICPSHPIKAPQNLQNHILTFHFPVSRTVRCKFTATAKIVCFSCNQIYRSAASGIKMCHKRLIIRIDCYKNTFRICFFARKYTGGWSEERNGNHRNSMHWNVFLASASLEIKVCEIIPFRFLKAGTQCRIALFFAGFCTPFTAIINAWDTRHTKGESIDQRQMIFI